MVCKKYEEETPLFFPQEMKESHRICVLPLSLTRCAHHSTGFTGLVNSLGEWESSSESHCWICYLGSGNVGGVEHVWGRHNSHSLTC